MLAQVPNSTAGEIGAWIIAFAGVAAILVLLLTGVNQWRQLVAKPAKLKVPMADRYITRAEHEKTEMKILQRMDRHEEYTRERLHELGNTMQAVNLKVASQPSEMRSMLDVAIQPLHRKIDSVATLVAALSAKAGIDPKVSEDINT